MNFKLKVNVYPRVWTKNLGYDFFSKDKKFRKNIVISYTEFLTRKFELQSFFTSIQINFSSSQNVCVDVEECNFFTLRENSRDLARVFQHHAEKSNG